MAQKNTDTKYAYLDQLRTEELDAILRAEMQANKQGDTDMIDYILGVILEREQNIGERLPDTEKSLDEFKHLYCTLDGPLYPMEDIEDTSEQTVEVGNPFSGAARQKPRRLKRVLLAAAIIAALMAMTSVSILGYKNVIQMVAHWTAEYFEFQPAGTVTKEATQTSVLVDIPEEYSELQDILSRHGIHLQLPRFPNGFEAEEQSVYNSVQTGNVDATFMYVNGAQTIMLNIVYQSKEADLYLEKDGTQVEICTYNGTDFYIFSNNKNNVATWYLDGLEYMISTTLSASDLKEILKSSYEV